MSEVTNENVTATEASETETKGKNKQTENDKKAQAIFDSPEAAREVKPDNPKYKLLEIEATEDIAVAKGTKFYTWKDGPQWGLILLGMHFKLDAHAFEKATPRQKSREEVLAEMDENDLIAAAIKKAEAAGDHKTAGKLRKLLPSTTANTNAAAPSEALRESA